MADKYDMPVLGREVAAFLDKLEIDGGNVAHCFLWADKFGAIACKRKCQDYMKCIAMPHQNEGAYYPFFIPATMTYR